MTYFFLKLKSPKDHSMAKLTRLVVSTRTSSFASPDSRSQRQRHHHHRCDGRGHYAHMKQHHVPLAAVLVPLILGSPSPSSSSTTRNAERPNRQARRWSCR
ncbi:hypothetical protein K439DRAFT_1633954 [Ramaria rubella]|nr:hypothetical protein K439DRAFT_1633954 [Ramaria rubella]